jgi:hypothetical protein
MPYDRITAFGTSRGNLSDDERMRAQQGQTQAAIDAQMRALQAEIADRQAGRVFQGDQANQDRSFQGGMFDKNAALQTGLDKSATERALGVAGLQMRPSTMKAEDDRADRQIDLPVKQAQAQQLLAVINRLGARNAGPAGGMAGAGTPSVDPKEAYQNDLTMLSVLKGGQMPDFQGQEMRHQIAQMELEQAKRKSASDQAAGYVAAGDIGKAREIAAAAGTPLARVAPAEVAASRPVIQEGMAQIVRLAKAKDVQGVKPMFVQLMKALTDSGVDPQDAAAYLRSQLDPLMAKAGSNWGDWVDNTIGFGFGDLGEQRRRKDPARLARQQIGLPE